MECPEKYNKLIAKESKCIDECQNDDIYKYEYNSICYQQCPDKTFNDDPNNYTCYKNYDYIYYFMIILIKLNELYIFKY